jgi:hypothetical protein
MHIWFPPIISSSPMEFYFGLKWLFHSIWLSSRTIDCRRLLDVSVPNSMQEFLTTFHNSFNFFMKFGWMFIIIYIFSIHCHFLSRLTLASFFLIYCYYSCNALNCSLYMTLNYFKSFLIYEGNEMQNLGYYFCQIFQNVTPVLKPIVLFTSINLCVFYNCFFPKCYIQKY